MASIYSIMLLETFRKLVVRIVQRRLSKILIEKSILKGANFVGLPEKSIAVLIHILNNIIEDTIQKNYKI